jgi:hypothetical protein
MSMLETRIKAVLTAIGADIKALFSRGLPAGGATGQVLTKVSATDYEAAWANAPGGGAGGNQQVFVQQTQPTAPGPWEWWVTNAEGKPINFKVNDGL